jgi:hypothetical protein
MPGKVTIDLNRRTVGSLRLLWNRLTPTRGAKTVSGFIAGRSTTENIILMIGKNDLSIISGEKETVIPASNTYARCLNKAGITEIEISAGLQPEEIKTILDTLSDKNAKKASLLLTKYGIRTKVLQGNWEDRIIAVLKDDETSPKTIFQLITRGLTLVSHYSGCSAAIRPATHVGGWGTSITIEQGKKADAVRMAFKKIKDALAPDQINELILSPNSLFFAEEIISHPNTPKWFIVRQIITGSSDQIRLAAFTRIESELTAEELCGLADSILRPASLWEADKEIIEKVTANPKCPREKLLDFIRIGHLSAFETLAPDLTSEELQIIVSQRIDAIRRFGSDLTQKDDPIIERAIYHPRISRTTLLGLAKQGFLRPYLMIKDNLTDTERSFLISSCLTEFPRTQLDLALGLAKHPSTQPKDIAKIIDKFIWKSERIIDDPGEHETFDGRSEMTTEGYVDIWTNEIRPEVSHNEYPAEDIEKAKLVISSHSKEKQTQIFDELNKINPELAEKLQEQ